jgi:sialic acid synthase SpsE/D-lyxose ketol-isomerase
MPNFKNYLVTFEIANNHMGDIEHGKKLLDSLSAVCEGYDFEFVVKYQFRDLDTFIHPDYKGNHEFKFVKRFEETLLSDEQWVQLISHSKNNGFTTMCTPFDEVSVPRVVSMGFDKIKIASCSFTDWPLLEEISKYDLPIIASTAGSSQSEVDSVITFFLNRAKDLSIMHCVGLYPTPFEQLNLSRISYFQERYHNLRIGYSTHEDPREILPVAISVGLGATMFEKHVALPTEVYGINEYSSAMDDLKEWLESLKKSVIALNTTDQSSYENKEEIDTLMDLKRGVFAAHDLSAGALTEQDFFLSIPPQKGQLLANDLSKFITYELKRGLKKNESIMLDDVISYNKDTEIINIRNDVNNLILKSKAIIPSKASMEISHHYGIERFYETGITMFTIVNREYCKKIIAVLPGQNHPEQYHKLKEETFHILYGDLELILDGEAKLLGVGDVVTVMPEVRHIFSSKEGCVLEEISSTHIKDDSFYTDESIAKNKHRKTFINSWINFPF